MAVFKMIVLLCSLTATPNLDNCNEASAIGIDRMSRVSPTAERCGHDSQHEQAQLLYRDQIAVQAKHAASQTLQAELNAATVAGDTATVQKVTANIQLLGPAPAYEPADRKIKVLCVPSSPNANYN